MKSADKSRAPVQAAGGIVVRRSPEPLIAIVRLRKNKAWVLPKGKLKPGEDALAAARREFEEETGIAIEGRFIPLMPRRLKSGKLLHPFAVEGDLDVASIRSNTFPMEWPPRSGRQQAFPEVDRGGWFALPEARVRISEGQLALLAELEALLAR